MQYKTGTVTVTNGFPEVTGSGTQWLNEIQPGHVFVRAQLLSGKRVDDPVVYTVAGVQSNTQLTLTAPYSGTSGSGQLYGITRDLTPMGKPLLAPSSIGTVPIFNETVLKLEQQSNQLADGLGTAAQADLGTGANQVPTNADLGTASTKNVATNAQAIAGTAGVLPDAAGVAAFVRQYGVGVANLPIYQQGTLDSLIETRFWHVNTAQAAADGFPSSIGGELFVIGGVANGNYAKQFYFPVADNLNRLFARTRNNANWTGWVELYHTGNTVGTVSQSGGVPTGAIIQRGSNANGEFVRFADGTQICTKLSVDTASSVPAGNSASLVWVFPVGFTNINSVSANQRGFSSGDASSFSGVGAFPTNNSQTTLSAINISAGIRAFNPQAIAIGRWY